jgi:hypothetical protein
VKHNRAVLLVMLIEDVLEFEPRSSCVSNPFRSSIGRLRRSLPFNSSSPAASRYSPHSAAPRLSDF